MIENIILDNKTITYRRQVPPGTGNYKLSYLFLKYVFMFDNFIILTYN